MRTSHIIKTWRTLRRIWLGEVRCCSFHNGYKFLTRRNAASELASKPYHITEALTRGRSDPQHSKPRSKSQKEDKELEEISAFFSRRRSSNRYGSETQTRHQSHDAQPRSMPYDNQTQRCASSHGSRLSYGDKHDGIEREIETSWVLKSDADRKQSDSPP